MIITVGNEGNILLCCAVYKTKTARLNIEHIKFDYHIEFKASARRPGTIGALDWIAMRL